MVLSHTRIVHLNAKFRFLRKISYHLSQNDIQRVIKTCNLMCTYWQLGGHFWTKSLCCKFFCNIFKSVFGHEKSAKFRKVVFKTSGLGSQWPFVTLQKIHPCWKEMVSLIPNAGLAVLEKVFIFLLICGFKDPSLKDLWHRVTHVPRLGLVSLWSSTQRDNFWGRN